ncbi:MAG TPA: 4-hydroxythreonine-4-phosphate dehydrogenase [Epsilonproteobacteria bacterium]|nr:4-hydroxythreonine-4-phosphate dehydrogenase [Campylobacterota bacterium]
MKKVAISVGDLNGIGIELILKNHTFISQLVTPLYCIDETMLLQASQKLNLPIPQDFYIEHIASKPFDIQAGEIDASSGEYSFTSFAKAVQLAQNKKVDAICTLPIHKKAWELASVRYKGHTDALRDFCQSEAIMMLGCPALYVALFTEHIPLKDVAENITEEKLIRFLIDFAHNINTTKKVGILGLNPHAGDGGVLGDEEGIIQGAISKANEKIGYEFYDKNILVPDIAFTPHTREKYTHLVAMYHDQGLAPLKALYFDESINVSLNLPFVRTSVDHGTAFDIAYKKDRALSNKSYINAIRYIEKS